MLDSRCADYETAISDGIGKTIELLGICEHLGGWANGGARLAKGQLERMDYTQMKCAEVAHGARGGAEVERVTRPNQNDAQAIERCS